MDVLVKARLTRGVRRTVAALPATAWRRWRRGGKDMYVASIDYEIGSGRVPCRLLCFSHRTPMERRMGIVGDLRFALATTLDGDPDEIVHLYRQRGEAENRIQELKHGVAAGTLPTRAMASNAAWVRLAGLAYNLGIGIVRTLFPTSRPTIATFRWQVLQRGGRLTYHGRRWLLRVTTAVCDAMIEWRQMLVARFGPPPRLRAQTVRRCRRLSAAPPLR